MSKTQLYIGVMSGTSLDGIDVVVCDIQPNKIRLIGTLFTPIPNSLRSKLLKICQNQPITISQVAEMDAELGKKFSDSINQILKKYQLHPQKIKAIGCHGQTVWHAPNSNTPCSLQSGDPNIIAAQTSITTIADFRRKDVARGGQGAPLAPLFHNAICPAMPHDQWVLNLGGIANLTFIPSNQSRTLQGFDCGPANILMDYFYQTHQSGPFDHNGDWASQGQVCEPLLTHMLKDPFFQQPHPKSTGREYFNAAWLQQHLAQYPDINPTDIQRTLMELTVHTICDALKTLPHNAQKIWVCGGGAYNTFLIDRLEDKSKLKIETTEKLGIAPEWIEACCFAWLAKKTLHHQLSMTPQITGARQASILGAIWPVI